MTWWGNDDRWVSLSIWLQVLGGLPHLGHYIRWFTFGLPEWFGLFANGSDWRVHSTKEKYQRHSDELRVWLGL